MYQYVQFIIRTHAPSSVKTSGPQAAAHSCRITSLLNTPLAQSLSLSLCLPLSLSPSLPLSFLPLSLYLIPALFATTTPARPAAPPSTCTRSAA